MTPQSRYRELLRIRRIEEAIAEKYAEQEMRCPVHLSIGQEAVAVGVCSALSKADYLLSNHRAHAHYLAKGGNLKAMIAELYGKIDGCTSGRGGSMHLIDLSCGILGTTPIVGGTLPLAVGSAFASKLKGDNQITCIFFGEGTTEEGVFAESLNFASLHKLPVLFVCENNFYSVYSPMEVRQSEKRSRIGIAEAHGISTTTGDGNNTEEVYEKACKAALHIRNDEGPYFLEFETYRYREHCGPNMDPTRSEEEFSSWLQRCPVEKGRNSFWNAEMEKEIAEEISAAFSFAKQSALPNDKPNLEALFA